MKLTIEQKKKLRDKERLNLAPFKRETKQVDIQRLIDKHYPKPERFEIFESKLNNK